MDNVINFDLLRKEGQPNMDDFIDNLRDDVYKGAYFIRKNDGTYWFGCTEEDKVGQERLLYHIKRIIQFYIEQYPDFEVIKETAGLMGITEDEVLEKTYGDDDD